MDEGNIRTLRPGGATSGACRMGWQTGRPCPQPATATIEPDLRVCEGTGRSLS